MSVMFSAVGALLIRMARLPRVFTTRPHLFTLLTLCSLLLPLGATDEPQAIMHALLAWRASF